MSQELQNTAPAEQPVAAESEAAKQVPQEKVNELMGVAMAKGHQKGYNQAMAEIQARPAAAPPAQPASNVGMGGMAHVDQADIDRRVAEAYAKAQKENQDQALRLQQKAHGEKVINSLIAKTTEAQQRIPDFDAVTSRVDFTKIPAILHHVDSVDNSGDVLYHLAQEPEKLGTLMNLNSIDPRLAQAAMKKLSDSIKQNQTAEAKPQQKPPLNSMTPSTTGTGKKAPETAAEYRALYKGRFRI